MRVPGGAGGAGGVPSGKESGKGDKGNRAKLSDFEFVNMDGKRVVCRRKKTDEGSLYPLDGTAGTCSER